MSISRIALLVCLDWKLLIVFENILVNPMQSLLFGLVVCLSMGQTRADSCAAHIPPSDWKVIITPLTRCGHGHFFTRTGSVGRQVRQSKYAPTLRSHCTFCTWGKHMDEVNHCHTACKSCPLGTFSAEGWTHCQTCSGGWSTYSTGTASGNCYACARAQGTSHQPHLNQNGGSLCEWCTAGKYNNDFGQLCKNVPANTISWARATFYFACTAGTDSSDGQNCDACRPGKSNSASQNSCNNCAANHVANYHGATVCSACAAGKYSNDFLTCHDCAAGQMSVQGGFCMSCALNSISGRGSGSCQACSAGLFSNDGLSCQSCSAGKISAAGQSCVNCAIGKHSGTAAAQCFNCAPGKTSVNGQGCNNCAPGTYHSGGGGACQNCNAGSHWQPSSGATSCLLCTACPVGYVVDVFCVGFTDHTCRLCGAGLSTTFVGQDSCAPCTAGSYKSSQMIHCELCAISKTSFQGSADCPFCDVGFFGVDCEPCSAGHFKDTIGPEACNVCPSGFYSKAAAHQCIRCPMNTFSEAASEECTVCPFGHYNLDGGDCIECNMCQPGYYRHDCGFFINETNTISGTCEECRTCEPGQVLVDCDWRGARTNAKGKCKQKEFLSSTATCTDLVKGTSKYIEAGTGLREVIASSGLGGFNFQEIFGSTQDGVSSVDFICSAVCDGQQHYDSMQCNGPYGCNTQACAMNLGEQQIRLASACPLTYSSNSSYEVRKHQVEQTCHPCSACGLSQDGSIVNPHGLPDWGRGCAQECSRILCDIDTIYDWTVSQTSALERCKSCSELKDQRLCSSDSYNELGLQTSDVSGNRPRLHFDGCQGRRSKNEVTYGTCKKCSVDVECSATEYYAKCSETGAPCAPCESRTGAKTSSAFFVDVAGHQRVAYCQVRACEPGFTGVMPSGSVCQSRCSTVQCAPTDTALECLLPHNSRCVRAYPHERTAIGASLRANARGVVGVMPAHTNMLEAVSGPAHHFSSFENVLVDMGEMPEHLHQCVWNSIHITDNNMNQGAVSKSFLRDSELMLKHDLYATGSKYCTPILGSDQKPPLSGAWLKNASVQYPLLALQNTVAFTSVFPRRFLLNSSASAVHYNNAGQGYEFFLQTRRVERPTNVPYAGDLFLRIDLRMSHRVTLAVRVPTDRNISSALSWVPAWRFGLVAQENTLAAIDERIRLSVRHVVRTLINESLFSYVTYPIPTVKSPALYVNQAFRHPVLFSQNIQNLQ